ncbi:4-amino-4-deoxy-L-arabinose transferase [Noviherbaspirillum humi]|uniref:4-amino-4-deoxy-L-arabinose transferase n=1 Tax=Noviherbaspirillum humi TaxID=1688639 RepID=A0A239D6Y3_9BURK|nr:glycosyltransferase family 39 protein [Noviherbaspirillum humi]SNS28266.1 4-amino-4-deoxy-L-arabinose transferase [Noviherbaspirillum humi]
MTEPHKSKTTVWIVFLLFCIVWFYALGARTLVPTDEGRYAEMAREMVATGDFITPRLNGIKYFEKPPLQNWMNALTFALFGLGEWQARLWTGLCGLFGVVLTAYAGARVFNARTGFLAGAVLASSFFWAALGHVNTLDMGLSGMMTLALCGLLIAQRKGAGPRERRRWMLACWAGMALAVLSKGLIGVVLPGAVLVIYSFVARDWAIWKRLHIGAGLLVFFLITVPWFVLVSIKNPEFLRFFFIHEHFQRFTSKVHSRAGPPWYFLPILIAGIVPWLGIFIQSLWQAAREPGSGFQPKKIALVWAVFIFFFFSVSGSKLPSYILPIFPALGLLIAAYLDQASSRAVAIASGVTAAIALIGLAFVHRMPGMTDEAFAVPLYEAYMPWVYRGTVLALLGALAAFWIAFKMHRKELAALVLAAAGFLCSQLLMIGHEPLGSYAAGVHHLPALEKEVTKDTPIYLVGRYEQALPFYLRRTMTLVEHADEMAFGLEQEPRLWIPKRDDFVRKWRADTEAGKKSIAIMRPNIYEEFKQQGVPMRVIGQDPRRVIVVSDNGAAGQ